MDAALLHSNADALNKPLPKPDVITAEIEALSIWMTDILGRQENVKVTESAIATD